MAADGVVRGDDELAGLDRPGPALGDGRTRLTRRDVLAGLGALGAGAALAAAGLPTAAGATPVAVPDDGSRFPDGVIAGDPQPDGAVIWTRVVPTAGAATVLWEVAESPDFARVVRAGVRTTSPEAAHTLRVPVRRLRPDRWYWYRFTTDGRTSPVGRLRTAPLAGAPVEHLRFAFASCQQRSTPFVAHRAIAGEGVDFFMHLGDYVYVSDGGTITLDQYRDVYRSWRRDPLLRQLHAEVPLVAMWDDGEFYNGVDRLGDPARLAAGHRAWFESMPVIPPARDPERSYRSFAWGALADVLMIDVRQYRDPYIDDPSSLSEEGAKMFDPTRTTLGAAQERWLHRRLARSSAAWRLVGNPYNINPWKIIDLETPFWRALNPTMAPNAGVYAPNEAWDDYQAERRELLEHLARNGIDDTVFCSAHTHIYLASELQPDFDDPGSPSVAVDFVSGSLTADPDPRTYLRGLPPEVAEGILRGVEQLVIDQNRPYLRHLDVVDQGYVVVDATPDELDVRFRMIDTTDPAAEAFDGARFRVRRGTNRIEVVPVASPRGAFR